MWKAECLASQIIIDVLRMAACIEAGDYLFNFLRRAVLSFRSFFPFSRQ
jgi:hypothetical protein